MDPGVAAGVAAFARGESINVSAVCEEHQISRKTFYKYVARFTEQGVEGLFPRSRAPVNPATVVGAVVEEQIVRARKQLADAGWDNGATSIRYRLLDDGVTNVPSRATIHRVLVRRGMVAPAPRKRPRRACHRFERAQANALWQIDGFQIRLSGGQAATVLQLSDDHSRLDLDDLAADSENGAAAWEAFTRAAACYGLPAQLLSDNGHAFSGARRGWTASFEAGLRALGVEPITSRTSHPQTCSKNERGHRTLQQWLAGQPTPTNLAELQSLLDTYRDGYNNRRHQGIGMLTPHERYTLADRSGPAGHRLPTPLQVTRHANTPATVFRAGGQVTLDRRRRYQPQNR